jgi:hypothetical protein
MRLCPPWWCSAGNSGWSGRRRSRLRWPAMRSRSRRRGRGRIVEDGRSEASRRCCASPLDRLGLGLCRWGGCGAGESRTVCRWPPPPFIWRSATGAHQLDRAGTPPIRAREGKALSDPLGLRGGFGDQPNSLPLDLTLYYSFIFTFSRFVIDLCIEHASSSRSSVDGFSSYNSRFYSKTDSLTFWALVVRGSQAIP